MKGKFGRIREELIEYNFTTYDIRVSLNTNYISVVGINPLYKCIYFRVQTTGHAMYEWTN